MKPSTINNIIANREQLDDYFSFYKERFLKKQAENQLDTKSIEIGLAGKLIELKFASKKLLESFTPPLRWAIECGKNLDVSSKEKTIFYIWQDDILNYLPQDNGKGYSWIHKSESANISIPFGESHITAYDYDNKEAYYCMKSSEEIDIAHTAHPFRPLFHAWAQENDLSFVHSGGVEIEGVGILISGVSGRGKSTTSVSALLNHCGFIGDDYVLLENGDEKKGYPIYSCAYLNSDMVNQMEELKPWVIGVDHRRNNKALIDLMPEQDYFKEVMTLDFILFPNVVDSERLSIENVDSTSALAQIIFSSANQNGERMNKVFMQQVFDIIKDIPVYQFNMSRNPKKNVKYLKKFTKEWREENV